MISAADRKLAPWSVGQDRQAATFKGDPQVISAYCHSVTESDPSCWHTHPFAELALVADSSCPIGFTGGHAVVNENALLLHQAGEHHGAWNPERRAPCLWILHFVAEATLLPVFKNLVKGRSTPRVWNMTPDQSDTFKWMFLEIARERARQQDHHHLAESAWLKLLLLSIQRWEAGEETTVSGRNAIRPEVHRLWQLVHSAAEDSVESLRRICLQPNYDSLRHAFRKAFGCSPREMILRLKMQRAQKLLSETGLSIKEIASRCGYARQHEFARAFHQRVGLAPSKWRFQPPQSAPAIPFIVTPNKKVAMRNVESSAV